ncbi:putative dihydrofolate synthetase [Astathelohania contejeani]|uniref:Dihydrofolate synthetase n=1 Tax=Astathelohania contejeani TaxID=164912 RepID=A0ABQ7HZ95_9MICR|nr:putative dihydrofolate synthetase [Thelohania contejeani]
MGGLEDATNIFDSILMLLITSISFDHVEYLGPSLENIIKNKLSLHKPDSPALMIEQENVYNGKTIISGSHIEKIAKELIPSVNIVNKSKYSEGLCLFKYENEILQYKLLLEGEFQAYNSALSLHAYFTLKKLGNVIAQSISDEDAIKACMNTKFLGRLTWINNYILIDGSHNLAGIIHLKKYIKMKLKSFTGKIIWIMAISEKKDYKSMISTLLENEIKNDQSVLLTEFTTPENMPWVKCISPEILAVCLKEKNVKYQISNLDEILSNLKEDKTMYIICGSLYLVRDTLKYYSDKIQNYKNCESKLKIY